MEMSDRDGIGVAALNNEDFRNPNLLEDVFQGLMQDLRRGRLVVDLSKVESIMSLGVAVLVAAQGLALIHNTKIAFAGMQKGVRKILRLTGADQAISIHDSVDAAVLSLRASSRRKAMH